MKLLVSGCSVTHGAELYNGFMSPENVKKSFSSHLAKKLDLELINVALSGASNEYIFHSLLTALQTHTDIKTVLAVWTSPQRLYWKSNNRHYFFLPRWASSMIDLENFQMHDTQFDGAWITADSDEMVQKLCSVYQFFVNHYFDANELKHKLGHYKLCLKNICQSQDIKFYDTDINQLRDNTSWKYGPSGKHPTESDHMDISQYLYYKLFVNI